jgi:hypothetical protein
VDYVHVFAEPEPMAFIEAVRPDVHVNGAEYGENCVEAAAVRGVGAGALGALALALLLAVAPLAKVGGPHRGYAIGLVLGLAVITVVLLGMLRRPWAWRAAWVVPLGLVAGGWLHWSLGVLGLLFGLLWAYVLRVRRTVLSGGVSGGAPSE